MWHGVNDAEVGLLYCSVLKMFDIYCECDVTDCTA